MDPVKVVFIILSVAFAVVIVVDLVAWLLESRPPGDPPRKKGSVDGDTPFPETNGRLYRPTERITEDSDPDPLGGSNGRNS